MKEMTQNERLDLLVEEFKEDSVQYRNLETPKDTEGKKRILRSLMNIRMPKMMPASVLQVQDEYLRGRIQENGIVTLNEIPTIADQGSRNAFADKLSIWQGDITRLAVDAIVIGAGAGLSTAAGFTYGGERFEKYFGDFARKYGIEGPYTSWWHMFGWNTFGILLFGRLWQHTGFSVH